MELMTLSSKKALTPTLRCRCEMMLRVAWMKAWGSANDGAANIAVKIDCCCAGVALRHRCVAMAVIDMPA